MQKVINMNGIGELMESVPILKAAAGGLFSPNPGLVVWTWLVFFIMLIVLYKFAWKPILSALDEREEKIRKSIEDADRVEQEVKQIAEKNAELLGKAKDDVQRILAESRKEGERLREKIKKQAELEASELVEKAKLSINESRREAISGLKAEAAKLSIEIASKLVQENLDNDKNKKLANEYLNSLQKLQ